MQILCPSCATGYEIPETHLQRPRRLRCAQCGGEWRVPALLATTGTAAPQPDPWQDTPEPEPDAPPPPAPLDPLSAPAAVPAKAGRRDTLLWAALWGLSLLLIACGLLALWHFRVRIDQAWPPSGRLYRLLGAHLPHPAAHPP